MDLASIVGIIAGVVLILGSMIQQAGGEMSGLVSFWSPSSLMIVLGGTMAATAIGFRLNEILRVFTLVKFVISKPKFILPELVQELIDAATIYKEGGPAELEKHISNTKTPFISDGLTFIVNGIKLEDLRAILLQREEFRYKRESHESDLMKSLGLFSPAFGMVGTLIGLIFMLSNMDGGAEGMAKVGPAMGVALVTTFYGSMFASLIFNPFSEKLKLRNKENSHAAQLMIAGILLIWQKKHPLDVKDMLTSYIEPADRFKYFKEDE